jgi:putative membrane protein
MQHHNRLDRAQQITFIQQNDHALLLIAVHHNRDIVHTKSTISASQSTPVSAISNAKTLWYLLNNQIRLHIFFGVTNMKRKLNWKLIIAHLFINAIAISFLWLVPGVSLTHPTSPILSLLILGAAFGLLNAFVKPVIQFLTFPFLFVSFGLVVVVIYMAMLWLLERFTDLIVFDDFWSLTLGAVLLGVTILFLESLFGITPPIIDDARVKPVTGEN